VEKLEKAFPSKCQKSWKRIICVKGIFASIQALVMPKILYFRNVGVIFAKPMACMLKTSESKRNKWITLKKNI
jgi:hypothetical protein